MSKVFIPEGYRSPLDPYDTQSAIELVKRTFEEKLTKALILKRVTAPLFVGSETGLNDNLNGTERPVSFDILETGTEAQVVHSLAKWKRLALHKYGFQPGEGLYTNMNAIRRDEELSNIHSVYVDQWDWEKVIAKQERNIVTLKQTALEVVGAICDTLDAVKTVYPQIPVELSREVSFITSQELEDLYPTLTPKQRESQYLQAYKTALIMQIGGPLKSGAPHDGRAPDYDDWKLNGDILFWNDTLKREFEVSSMGIRVDRKSLDEQLSAAGCDDRRKLPFHSMLLGGELPLTMGGGIGQSRICMLLLGKAHIGEVQASIWDRMTREACAATGVDLL